MADNNNNNMTKDAETKTEADTCCHSALLTWLKCSGNAHQTYSHTCLAIRIDTCHSRMPRTLKNIVKLSQQLRQQNVNAN